MGKNVWTRVDRVMRWLHLYTGLFLVPWMLVYGASAFCLNHGRWINERFGITPPKWEITREIDFAPDDSFPTTPEEQARAILLHLDLDGPHRIQGRPNPGRMLIFRISGAGHRRVTWLRYPGRIIVERQPFSAYRLLHFLHFRGGYDQPYFASIAWAVVVDGVTLSIWLWVVSGIYIWARRPKRRLLGGVLLIGGMLLFVGLVVLLCS